MIQAAGAVVLIFINLIIYFLFGLILVPKKRKNAFSVTETVLAGFFFYYFLFDVFCIPIMLLFRPLSWLTYIWAAAVVIVSVISLSVSLGVLRRKNSDLMKYINDNRRILITVFIITCILAFVIIYNYQFTLDAAYYVANVTTSLETNTLNIYDPYTGDWQDHFEMRYFFAAFPLNDAVFCNIFKIHPLVWCKTTMAGVTVFLTNMVLFMTGKKLFKGDHLKCLMFVFFADLMNFFFITIFTTSTFLMTRTYEGKSLLANVVLPAVFYIYLKLFENEKDLGSWGLLFLAAIGSPVLSSSANMLMPAMIAVTILPLALVKKNWKIVPMSLICMLPGLALMLTYVAYVKGIFVFHTYPG